LTHTAHTEMQMVSHRSSKWARCGATIVCWSRSMCYLEVTSSLLMFQLMPLCLIG